MRESCFLTQPRAEQRSHALELLSPKLSVGDHLREHALRGPVEDRVANASNCASSGALGGDERKVSVGAPLSFVAHVALFLEGLERREDRRVGEILLEGLTHFGDAR